MLYLGYVGFTIPFAFALGALIMHYPGEKWIHITRRWTMVTWCFLTIGVFLGAHWAYAVLGWGGYWGWDPVENASLMPWLTGTAFLHSVMMQEKRGMLKVWNMSLVFATFLLSMLGTFLTRSGVISSVHAFAQSSIGSWFTNFYRNHRCRLHIFSGQESAHLRASTSSNRWSPANRVSCSTISCCWWSASPILWGTFFPIISEWVQGHKVTVGPPFFNRVAIPVALLLMLLTAVGPLLAWRKTSIESLKRNFLFPAIGSVAVGLMMILFGVKPWEDPSLLLRDYGRRSFPRWSSSPSSRSSSAEAASSPARADQNIFAAMLQLCRRNTRRYGGYIVHFGVALVVIGILGTPFNQRSRKRDGLRRQDQHRPLYARLPVLHAGRQSELRQRVGHHQCLPRRQADHDHVSRTPLL